MRFFAWVAFCALCISGEAQAADFTALVNPFIGTTNGGATYPGATLPYGMIQWSPRTAPTGSTSDYEYQDSKIIGFPLTHLSGTGCGGASGDVPIMPYPGRVTASPEQDRLYAIYADNFLHQNENASPGYYRVRLDSGTTVELTTTERTGSGRFTYPIGAPETVLIRSSDSQAGSSNAHIEIDRNLRAIRGWVNTGHFCHGVYPPYYTVYFVAYFERPFAEIGAWHDSTVMRNATQADGGGDPYESPDSYVPNSLNGSGAWVTFLPSQKNVVQMRVGISFVSEANAEANLHAENPAGTSFDTIRSRARAIWNDHLQRLRVSGGTRDQTTIFYTALYHTMVQPNLISDVNGQYPGFDKAVHTVPSGQRGQYSDFDSLWDIYRSYLQLVTLIDPKTASDFAKSLFNIANQTGGDWDRTTHISGLVHTMNGDDADPAVADIVAFGGSDFDLRAIYDSLVSAATIPSAEDLDPNGCPVSCPGERPSLNAFEKLHYIPAQAPAVDGAVSDTLEDATDDFALAQLAQRLGDDQRYQFFTARSAYWRNLYNPHATAQGGYLQPRNADGSWPAFDPTEGDPGFVEASGAIYLWMVPFDERGLFDLLGGNTIVNRRLDTFFHNGDGSWAFTDGGLHADLTNEPSLETPWLYDFSGEPYKTQQVVRQILTSIWTNTPEGIAGNDDMGEMSSWYVWAALGLYPEIPGRAELVLASPLFPKIDIVRPSGNISIKAPGASASTFYIQALQLNGTPYNRPWLPASFVERGGTLLYTLSATPDLQWGSDTSDAPPSFESP